jgi:hypothetical protein
MDYFLCRNIIRNHAKPRGEMKPPKSLILLKKRCMRGSFLFATIALVALLSGGVSVAVPDLRIWIGFAFFVAGMSLVALHHVRFRYHQLAYILSSGDVIYWAQERPMNSNLTEQALSGKQSLRMHLKSGEHLDIDVSTDEMEHFREWVSQRSPHVQRTDFYK